MEAQVVGVSEMPVTSAEALLVIKKLSGAAKDTLSNVALGGRGYGKSPSSLAALVRKGLIEEIPCETSDRLGKFSRKEYETPTFVHIAWCEWCAGLLDA